MGIKLWLLCCDIIERAYKGKDEKIISRYKKVFFEISTNELKSKHGDYDIRTKKIRLFNLSRDDKSSLCTSLHELAHHIDNMNRGDTDHSNEFYEVYEQLIKAALEMKLVTKEQILSLKRDASDSIKVKKIVEKLNITQFEEYKADKKLIRVSNCFSIKDNLNKMNYTWNGLSKLWEKEVDNNDLEIELEKVYALIDKKNVDYIDAKEIKFDSYSYVLVKDSYAFKEQLSERGYFYDGIKKGWKKKFNNKEIKKEVEYIKNLGLSNVKIVS